MNKPQVMQSASRIIESRSSNQGSGQDLLGRIVTHYGHQLDVETLEGPRAGSVQRCHKRANLPGHYQTFENDKKLTDKGEIIQK